jgi:hypothetical protein
VLYDTTVTVYVVLFANPEIVIGLVVPEPCAPLFVVAMYPTIVPDEGVKLIVAEVDVTLVAVILVGGRITILLTFFDITELKLLTDVNILQPI